MLANGKKFRLKDNDAMIILSVTRHYLKNPSKGKTLKIYTIYAEPERPEKKVHRTKADAERDKRHH